MDTNVKVSIIVPTHDFPNSEFFLNRCLNSIREQSFQDYEIIIKKTGKGMAHNLNEALREAKGELIKVLFTDDYFHDKHALKRLVEAHKGHWTVTGCVHSDLYLFKGASDLINPHYPEWNSKMASGMNTIGSPSVLLMKNDKDLPRFDENLQWLIDCDYYQRMFDKYGAPTLFDDLNVVIGLHDNQETKLLSAEVKESEEIYVKNKFA